MSKGSNIRPRDVPKSQFDKNWEKAFGKFIRYEQSRLQKEWESDHPVNTSESKREKSDSA